MRLAFVDGPADARAAPAGATVVAVGARAQVALGRAGVAYLRPETWLPYAGLEDGPLDTFATFDALAARLDDLAALDIPAIAAHRLKPGTWDPIYVKALLDLTRLRVLQVASILDAERPSEVISFPGTDSLARVVPVVARARGIPHRTLDPVAPDAPARRRASLRSRIAGRLRRGARTETAGRGPAVLCLDTEYSVPAIADALRGMGFATAAHHPVWPHAATPLPRAAAAAGSDDVVRTAFVVDGIDVWPAVEAPLLDLLGRNAAVVANEHARATDALRMHRPVAVITSMAAVVGQKAACNAARTAGVPVFVARHGELGMRDVELVARQDVASVDAALCWGAWEETWVHEQAPAVATFVTGAPMIESRVGAPLRRAEARRVLGIDPATPVALYVPTALSYEEWYASHRAADDSTYFAEQMQMVMRLRELGWRVVVKDHPFHRPSALELRLEGEPGIDVVFAPSHAQLIHLADLTVLDAPSTTLAEALFGSAAIVAVDNPVFRWRPGVREHLIAHGVQFVTADALDIRPGDVTPAPYGREAREPIVSVTEEDAAVRAARAVAGVVRGSVSA